MPISKNAIIRYQALDKCFRNKYLRYFIDDLVEECNKAIYNFSGNSNGIKKRQVYDDINFMGSENGYNAPIKMIETGSAENLRLEGFKTIYKFESGRLVPKNYNNLTSKQQLIQVVKPSVSTLTAPLEFTGNVIMDYVITGQGLNIFFNSIQTD